MLEIFSIASIGVSIALIGVYKIQQRESMQAMRIKASCLAQCNDRRTKTRQFIEQTIEADTNYHCPQRQKLTQKSHTWINLNSNAHIFCKRDQSLQNNV